MERATPKPASPIEPACIELRPGPDGSIEIWLGPALIGGIEPEPGAIRIVLGDADPGAGFSIQWEGGPASIRVDLTTGRGNL